MYINNLIVLFYLQTMDVVCFLDWNLGSSPGTCVETQ